MVPSQNAAVRPGSSRPRSWVPQKNGGRKKEKKSLIYMGCTSFGGPIAHLGYFREEFVVRLMDMVAMLSLSRHQCKQRLTSAVEVDTQFFFHPVNRCLAARWVSWPSRITYNRAVERLCRVSFECGARTEHSRSELAVQNTVTQRRRTSDWGQGPVAAD